MSFHKLILSFFILLLPFTVWAQQEEVVLTGVYNGKNLYIQNPLSSNMKDYCTKEVWVNGERVFVNPRTSAFIVNLSHLKNQEPVAIRILYSIGCVPKVINPQVIKTRNNFRYLAIQVDAQNLEWLTSGEVESGKFFVEKLVERRWEPVASLDAYGKEDSRYQAEVEHHSGENQYRIKYLQQDGEIFYSRVYTYESPVEPVTFAPTRVSDKIYLSRETEYTISDPKGNQLLQGFGKEIELGHLNSGLYYLNIDNRVEKFYKK